MIRGFTELVCLWLICGAILVQPGNGLRIDLLAELHKRLDSWE